MSYISSFYTKTQFIEASQSVANFVKNKGDLEQMSLNLQHHLFKGGSAEPKSLTQLLSISTPSSTVNDPQEKELMELKRSNSLYGIVSLLEGVPVLGSVIALLSCLGHLIALARCQTRLENASKRLLTEPNLDNAKQVYTHAVDFAKHDYYLEGSALAIIPFLKPLRRIAQAAAYAFGARPKEPIVKLPAPRGKKPRKFEESNNKKPDPKISVPTGNSVLTRKKGFEKSCLPN